MTTLHFLRWHCWQAAATTDLFLTGLSSLQSRRGAGAIFCDGSDRVVKDEYDMSRNNFGTIQ
jgi:hypothetical protein